MKSIVLVVFIGLFVSMGNCFGQWSKEGNIKNDSPLADRKDKEGYMRYYYTYNPKMRLFGDTLYVATVNGLYRKNLREKGNPFSLVAFEGVPVVDFAKSGERYLASAYGNTATNEGLLFFSEDGGSTHRDITPSLFKTATGNQMFRMAVNQENPSSLIVCQSGEYSRFFQTFDFGKSWRLLETIVGGRFPVLASHAFDTTLIFQAGSQYGFDVIQAQIARSEDNGNTWIAYGINDTYTVLSMAFHPQKPQVMLYADGAQGIGKSTDGGKNWFQMEIPSDGGIDKVLFDGEDPRKAYGITHVLYFPNQERYNVSLYISMNEGNTWDILYRWDFSFEETGAILDVLYYQNSLLFYTMKGGVLSLNLDKLEFDETLPVAVMSQENSPLLIAYPNPVRDILHVETAENIKRVVVMDMSGRTVKEMFWSESMHAVEVRDLRPGVYVVCFFFDRGCVRKKISVI